MPFEIDQAYLAASAFRFIEGMDGEDARRLLRWLYAKDASEIIIPRAMQTKLA